MFHKVSNVVGRVVWPQASKCEQEGHRSDLGGPKWGVNVTV